MSRPSTRGSVCVILAAAVEDPATTDCLASLRANTPGDIQLEHVAASAAEVNQALARLAPADVIVLDSPCRVSPGWVDRLRRAACADTNTATASALSDAGTELALRGTSPQEGLDRLAGVLQLKSRHLRPRLSRAVGPCVYIRRETLELVGDLDEALDLDRALELDLAQRCLLAGLAHVAADDVIVAPLLPRRGETQDEEAGIGDPQHQLLRERYPYLSETPLAQSPLLAQALEAARGSNERLSVTLDARALDGGLTGTQVHVLELIGALARTQALHLRVLVWSERIDVQTLALLRGLPDTEILPVEEIGPGTPRSTVFHRPQQAFSHEDVALALALGERIVLSQLDLIAYCNPGYFPDAAAWQEFRRASRQGISAAERLVVFSEHTRRELLADALAEDARIRVVPPGLDHTPPGEPQRPASLESELEDGFLLCLGTDFRHKNRMFALRLLAALRDDHGWEGSMVLAGTHIPHGSSRELERAFLARRPDLGDSVLELGAVSEQEKSWLLDRAGAVIYPSVYEGFGLVPFESALRGVPCVFASQSSLAEIAPMGTATIVPWDVVSSAAAVHRLLSDPVARERQVRLLAGAARELTWPRSAARMVEVYRETAAAPVREAAILSRDGAERERVLTEGHRATAQTLIDERELVLRDYNKLIEELGPGRGLVGTDGALPDELQRGLLAVSARPGLSRALFGGLSRVHVLVRAFARRLPGGPGGR